MCGVGGNTVQCEGNENSLGKWCPGEEVQNKPCYMLF